MEQLFGPLGLLFCLMLFIIVGVVVVVVVVAQGNKNKGPYMAPPGAFQSGPPVPGAPIVQELATSQVDGAKLSLTNGVMLFGNYPVTFEQIVELDQRGQLIWVSNEARTWTLASSGVSMGSPAGFQPPNGFPR